MEETNLSEAEASELARCRELQATLNRMFNTDPRSAAFLRQWRQGNDPVVELMRLFGPELRQALDDPALQERLAEANREYLERVAAAQSLSAEFEANIDRSLEMLELKCERENIPDATIDAAWEWLRRITDQGIRGIVSEEAIDMALKAISHDSDVADADRRGEIRGRNAAIEAHLRRQTASAGDGTVARGGSPAAASRRLPPLGVLDRYDAFTSVWD